MFNVLSIDSNWTRCYKGYYYEMCIQELLENSNIKFTGNPQVYYQWKQVTQTDYDIMCNGIKIECKLTLTPIYHSWFIRDWYNRKCDVIVTNCKWNLANKDREALKENNVLLLETHELSPFIKVYGNKFYNSYSSIVDRSSIIERYYS